MGTIIKVLQKGEKEITGLKNGRTCVREQLCEGEGRKEREKWESKR
jgi:hypothetical protein